MAPGGRGRNRASPATTTELGATGSDEAQKQQTTTDTPYHGTIMPSSNPNERPKVLPAKMATGTMGRKVIITTNAYEVNTEKVDKSPFFRYELDVIEKHANGTLKNLTGGCKNDTLYNRKRRTCYMAFFALAHIELEFFKEFLALVYDRSRTLYTSSPLDIQKGGEKHFVVMLEAMANACGFGDVATMKKELDIRDHVQSYQLNLWPASGADEGHSVILGNLSDVVKEDVAQRDRTPVQFIENALRSHIYYNDQHVLLSNAAFARHGQDHKIGDGMVVRQGLSMSARAVEGAKGAGSAPRIIVTADVKTCAFFEAKPVIEVARLYFNKRDDRQLQYLRRHELGNLMKDLAVNVTSNWYNRQFVCAGVTEEPLTNVYQNVDGKQVNVVQLYQINGVKIHYPNLPALIEMRGANRQFHALELCVMAPFQRVGIMKQKATTMQSMIKLAALDPLQRQQRVGELLQQTKAFNNSALDALNLEIKKAPIAVGGRVLPKPSIRYKGNRAATVDENGGWRMMPNTQYLRPATMPRWAVLVVHDAHLGVKEIGGKVSDVILSTSPGSMRSQMMKCGMKVPHAPEKFTLPMTALPNDYDIIFKQMTTKGIKFVLVCGGEADTHEQIKLNEGRHCIVTQHIQARTLYDPKFGRFTVGNVVAKTNMKLGGLNYSVDTRSLNLPLDFDKDIMFVGIDVNHPAPLSAYERRQGIVATEPSVVGFAYSVGGMEFRGNIVFQQCRKENTDAVLGPLFRRAINEYRRRVGRPPLVVHVFRDGVSTGQYGTDLKYEEEAFREELRLEAPNAKLVISIVTKRHNIRLYDLARQAKRGRASEMNVQPGTVVDSGVVDAAFNEFYMVPHKALQGTAKPPRCTLFTNDDKTMTTDIWQAQIYALAFAHDVVTSTISLPAPVYCAHNLAKRGKLLLKAHRRSTDSNRSLGTDSGNHSRTPSTASRTSGGNSDSDSGDSLHGIEFDLSVLNTELNYYTLPFFSNMKFWA